MSVSIKNNFNDFYLIKNTNYTLISVSLCKFLYGFYTSAFGSILVPIGESFKINFQKLSIIFLFNYFGQIIIIFFIGYFSDKVGKKILQTASLFLLGLFALLFKFISSFYLILILFFFMGIFGISINTIADATVSDTFVKKKGFYLNITHIFFGLGAMTAPIIFNITFFLTEDFRTIYLILFIISFLILFLILIARYPVVNEEKIRPVVIINLLKNRIFMYLCIFSLFLSGSETAVSGWIPTLFQKNLNISPKISNYSLSFFWISIVIGRVIMAFLSQNFTESFLIKILNIFIFFTLAASFFLDNYILLLTDYILFGLLLGGVFPLIIAYSAKIYPRYSTTRLAVIFSFTAVGMLIMPAIIGFLAEYFLIYKIIPFTSFAFFCYIYIFFKNLK